MKSTSAESASVFPKRFKHGNAQVYAIVANVNLIFKYQVVCLKN